MIKINTLEDVINAIHFESGNIVGFSTGKATLFLNNGLYPQSQNRDYKVWW